MTSSQNTVV